VPQAYLGRRGRKEVVHLLVNLVGTREILCAADLCLNQVVAVDGGRDRRGVHACGHELEERHLRGGILASDSLQDHESRYSTNLESKHVRPAEA
jgi:hypothetical protein